MGVGVGVGGGFKIVELILKTLLQDLCSTGKNNLEKNFYLDGFKYLHITFTLSELTSLLISLLNYVMFFQAFGMAAI